jgi:SAM-dependent methyltransferase
MAQSVSKVSEQLNQVLKMRRYTYKKRNKHVADLIIAILIRDFIKKAKRKLPKNNKMIIIDIGCGNKPYEDLFPNNLYIGIDIDPHSNADIIASADAIPIRDEIFDLALLTEVLEHTPEPAIVLSEINRILKPGGFLILTVPQYWFLHEIPNDFYRFTIYGIHYLLKKSGFELVFVESKGGRVLMVGMQLIFLLTSLGKIGQALSKIIIPLILLLDNKIKISRDTLGWCVLARKP